ncbi:MAG: hypothetical protein DIZ80_06455 [endosymbiont of Galathealinum brachiosum]|uniref:Glycosyltransferase WbuB n=1 Tax=endosymbiont of Galathealinum brachiosum TaxID=2200906 RepID=A0A370DFS4_9GAMM|nr:MAG: hypothetical protein DIZ80_06455 [endosymbiont of Galathealinum brachiosum]
MRILYHHRTQGRGAEGVHIVSIVKALESLGHDVTVLSPAGVNPLKNAGNAPVDKSDVKTSGIDSVWKFISKNLPNFIFEFIEIFYNIPASIRLEKELSNNNYDIIYERYAFYLVAGAIKAKKYKIPFVLEANEVSGIEDRARKQIFKKLCDSFERFLFIRCSSILTVSSFLKQKIIKQGVSTDLVHVVPNAIDVTKFHHNIKNDDLKNKFNIGSSVVIGFAGWFDDWDRLDLLIEVFNGLTKNYPVKLLLIGDGEVLNNVKSKAKEYKIESDIILTGAVDRLDVQRYLSLLDIAIITHSNDFGSPVVMFEFMGLKIPVIAPDLMPILDVLENDKTALIFKALDMKALKLNIIKLLEDKDKRNQISSAAYVKLIDNHTWEKNAQMIISTI